MIGMKIWGAALTASAGLAICAALAMPLTALASAIDRPFLRASQIVIVFSADDFYEENWTAPIVHDFVLLDNVASGTAGSDIIDLDGVAVNFPFDPVSNGESGGWPFQISGQPFGGVYTNNPSFQMLDANDSYSAFGVDGDTDIDLLGNQVRFAWFFVASNAAFDIYAHATNLSATGDFSALGYGNIDYSLILRSPASTSIGQRSQNPATGASGIVIGGPGNWSLANFSSGPVKVFDGGRKTAAQRGTIAQQAVGFASVYRLTGSPVNGNNYDLSMGTGILSADVTYTIYAP